MKKIDKLVLLDFLPPYLMAFFVVEFVLVMQFLWKYIDEFVGKGFSFGVLLEMLFYFSVRTIPEAVPVTILIASVMVFGNLAEKYEISSMKSAGISLTRIMMMGVLIAIFTACFSLLASNYLKPRANYKFFYRFNAIRKQKPALNLAEGVFSKDFRNFVIRVGDKEANERDIKDVIIYDHSGRDRKKINMLVAKTGQMYAREDNNNFIMELNDGE
ncbi:MAG: LptF/LptG family permease, partial [Bacteroidia bacterium]|nr:LptF/LptG family permease [Bacteroidia bacterium]